MNTKTLFVSTIALMIGSSIVPQNAQAEISMTIGIDEGYHYIMVPDRDTTAPAYGGKLRLYDVHIAKMFEVTNDTCIRGRSDRGIEWTYTADRGNAKMGTFVIRCQLARDIATAYGLGRAEATTFEGSRKVNMIPTLNITGSKVDKWIRFTNNFKPVR
jgi:hypothetical protein